MIHKFKMFNLNVVVDVNSGGVFVFHDLAYEMLNFIKLPMVENCSEQILEKFKNHEKNEIFQTYSQIYELYSRKLLFSDNIDCSKFKHLLESSKIKAMCLHVAHDCNLRCEYCFASTGNFGGRRELMSFETAKSAINFLINYSGNRKNLEVDFFGGEPLMNFDIVKKTVCYAKSIEKKHSKNFRFTITTNGTLLDDSKAEYINEVMSNVVLSLDGRKQVNDSVRKMADGKSSCYDIAVSNFVKFVKLREKNNNFPDYYVRGTFTNKNLDFVEDVLHLYDCGFNQISVEPVVSKPFESYAISQEHLNKILEQYDLLAKKIVELKQQKSKINFFHFMVDLKQGPCIVKRFKGCGCGTEYVAVAPDGSVFPCHQFVGNEEFKMGNVFDGHLNESLLKKFGKANLLYKNYCKNCWAKFYCSGGCNANNFQLEGSLLKPNRLFCEMEKKRVECAIAINVVLNLNSNSNSVKED